MKKTRNGRSWTIKRKKRKTKNNGGYGKIRGGKNSKTRNKRNNPTKKILEEDKYDLILCL